MPCDTVANWHDPAFTNYMNDLSFRLPDNFPSARSLLLIATSAPLMIINLRFADRHIPVFMPPNYPFHGLTRAMLLEIRRTIIQIPVTAWTGSITIFRMKLAAVRADWRNTAATTSYVEGMGELFIPTPT